MRRWASWSSRRVLRRASSGTSIVAIVAAVTLAFVGFVALALPQLAPVARAATPTFSVLKTLDLGSAAPFQVAVNPNTNDAFVASGQSNKLWVVKDAGGSSSLLVTLTVPSTSNLYSVAVNPATGDVFITSWIGGSNVYVTHDDGAATAVPTAVANHGSDHLFGVAVNPNTGHVFVADQTTNQIFVYKDAGTSSSLISTFATTADRPDEIAVNPSNNHVYVEHNSDAAGDLNIFQDGTGDSGVSLLTSVSVGVIGYGVGVNPTTGHIFFTGVRNAPPTSYDEIAVIQDNGASTSASDVIQRSDGPDVQGVVVDPSRNYVFIATPFGGSNGVQLYQDVAGSGSNVLTSAESINTGASPHFFSFNPATNDLIVPDYGNGSGTSIAILSDGIKTVTNANDAGATTSDSSVTLSSAVLSGDSPVTEGGVTFTVTDSTGKMVGSAVSGTLDASGRASASFAIPSGTAAGDYTISAAYVDAGGSHGYASSLGTSTLTISATLTPTVTVADDLTIDFQGQLNLSATVTAGGQPVSEGLISFTVTTPDNQTTICSASVAPFGSPSTEGCFPSTFPTGLRYTIHAVYTDGLGKYAQSSDTSTLYINPVATLLQAQSASASYGATSVNLSATVSMIGPYLNQINEGTITFSVIASDGHTVLCTATATPGGIGVGTAACDFATPPAPGTYAIHASFSDPGHVFEDSSDNTQKLTINPIPTQVSVGNVNASYGTETFDLTASVRAGIHSVFEGTVNFIIYPKLSGTPLCRYSVVSVSNGSASSPSGAACAPNGAPLAAGSYTIYAAYNDSSGKYASSQGVGTLTIGQVSTQVFVSNASALYGQSSINLDATVSPIGSSDVVDTGTITFDVSADGHTYCSTQSNVSNGIVAGAACDITSLPLPTVGQYQISATYTDSSGNFVGSSNTGTLTVTARDTTTSTGNMDITYGATSVSLSATVTAKDDASLTVDEGTATFTVSQGTNTFCTSNAIAVSQGQASEGTCAIGLLDAGNYTITASYHDAAGNFSDSSNTATLTIEAATSQTHLTSSPIIVVGTAIVPLSGSVTATGLTVGQGSVTFVVTDSQGNQIASQSGDVSGGEASITLNLPAGTPIGVYTVTASYHDASGDFTDSSDTRTLTITNGTVIVGGNPIIVRHDYWALVRVQVVDADGTSLASRTLKVTAQNLAPADQPWNGESGNFVYPFQYGSSIPGYQLAINSRPLSIGDYTLSYTIAGDPVIHTVTIRVVP